VDETHYQNESIQKIFELIEQDEITPEERYDMFEEAHRQEEMQSSEAVGRLKEKKEMAKNLGSPAI